MGFTGVKVPPDSTGSQIQAGLVAEIEYNTGTTPFKVEETVIGLTSGAVGTITKIAGNTSSGDLYLAYDNDSPVFVTGETLQMNGINCAIAGAVKHSLIQYVIAVGANNYFNRQYIDARGSSSVRFSEGSPQFDAFGGLRVSTAKPVGSYTFRYDTNEGSGPNQIFTETVGGGTSTVTHLPTVQGFKISVGTGNGHRVCRTTNKYHPYHPGNGQLTEMTVVCGDTGKANLVRSWGYYDDNNGVFFEHNDTGMCVVLRSKSTGVVLEERIYQADWNHDKLNGEGGLLNLSSMTLDETKLNIYWMDIQWLGAGRVRFGVVTSAGERILCHDIHNANSRILPYMGTGSLPLRWEIYNTGVTGSTSEMSVICAAVKSEGEHFNEHQNHHMRVLEDVTGSCTGSSDYAALLIRSSKLINGIVNRRISLPETISVIADKPYKLEWYIGVTPTGSPTWITASGGAIETAEDIHAFTNGNEWLHMLMGAGSSTEDIDEHFSPVNEHLCLRADGEYGNVHAIVIKPQNPADTLTYTLTLGWFDMD